MIREHNLASGPFLVTKPMPQRVISTVMLFALLVGIAFCFLTPEASSISDPVLFARPVDSQYATSDSCIACHPDQHASWHGSFHRTMTQPATPQTVVAPFENVTLRTADTEPAQVARLSRKGDEFWVNTVDQDWERRKFATWTETRANDGDDPYAVNEEVPPRVDAKVVMTTGSHHFQAFWIAGKEGSELWQFPWRYHIAERRWVHRKDVFLAPPEWRPGMWFRVWNNQCIYCHSTGPYPGKDVESGVMTDTRVAELGIACEACHGPAEDHIAFHRNGGVPSDPIVNPAKLGNVRSSQVCGSCHSHFSHADPDLSVHGPKFRPGEDLLQYGDLLTPPKTPQVMSRFWEDGVNRSGGREYSGVAESACFLQGNLSCVSCHSMHDGTRDDQLSADGRTNNACLQCHSEFEDADSLSNHTHHSPESSGSECFNCHMPHTNYALYKAIRNHQINIPKVVPLASNTRPNACNLCHLDQTQQWTADHLEDWYSIQSPKLSFDDRYVAAGVLWALKGDAGQRIIAAWHFGWSPARSASGNDWMVPSIVQLMKDPYAAVRWVAYDALRRGEVPHNITYDFDDAPESRVNSADSILAEWLAHRTLGTLSNEAASRWPRVLFTPNGLPDDQQMLRILSERDTRMVAGVE